MARENLDQALGWSPVRYPKYTEFEDGQWRIVEENGAPVAVIWTNNDNSAGISWVTQSDTVMAIHRMFLLGAEFGLPAAQTYQAVESAHQNVLAAEFTGAMRGADETMSSIIRDMMESD